MSVGVHMPNHEIGAVADDEMQQRSDSHADIITGDQDAGVNSEVEPFERTCNSREEWFEIVDSAHIRRILSKRLVDDGEKRSFWVDNALAFLQLDRIPQCLMDIEQVVFLSEAWLRAAAERGYFEEEWRQSDLTRLLLRHPRLRWYTAWVAAEHGHQDMVLRLIQSAKPCPPKGWEGEFYDWFLSCSRWYYIIWEFLMQRNISTTQMDFSVEWKSLAEDTRWENGWTFLHFAASRGSRACILKLLSDHDKIVKDLDCPTDDEGYTALHLAAYYGNVGIVDLLLKHGAQVNVSDKARRTPLHHASEQGCLESVSALLQHAAAKLDTNMELCNYVEMGDVNGMTALHLAACRGHSQVVSELLSRAPKQDPSLQSSAEDLTLEKAFTARSLRRWRSKSWMFTPVWLVLSSHVPEAYFNSNASSFLRPNRLKSEVWSPGGFSALHFAVVYGNNIDTIQVILQHEKSENLVTIKDSLGLTPTDWAEAVDLQKETREILGSIKRKDQDLDQNSTTCEKLNVTCINSKKMKAKEAHYQEVKEAEQERMRLQWALDISEALLALDWDDARRLTWEGVQQKMKVDDGVWEHLEWAYSGALMRLTRIREYRVSMVERMVVELVKGEVFSNNTSTMQRCLMWAIQQEMVDLVEAIVRSADSDGKNKCDLLSVARGCDHKKSPLQAATDIEGERGSQLVAVMEQREDVQRRLYEDRQVYVDYANTILVGAVLIAALAYQGWVQAPQGYAAMPLDSKLWGMQVYAWCNSLGFFMSMGAVMAAAVAAMPLRSGRLVKFREKSMRAGVVASVLMAVSVACEVLGFAFAVVSVRSHDHEYKSMVGLASISTIIVFMLAAWFVTRLHELQPFLNVLVYPLIRYVFKPLYVCVFKPLYVCVCVLYVCVFKPLYVCVYVLYVCVYHVLYVCVYLCVNIFVFDPLKDKFGPICLSAFNIFIGNPIDYLYDRSYRLERWADGVADRLEELKKKTTVK